MPPIRTENKVAELRGSVRKRQKEAEGAATRRSTRKRKSTETDQPHHANKQTNLLYPQDFAGKVDNISVAEVAEMVKKLNAEIEQVSCLMTDSLSYRRLPESGSKLGMALNELQEYLGTQLCNELQRRSNKVNMELGPLITQITLQTGLVNTCSRIIMLSDWDHPFWGKDSTSSRMVSNMERAEQVVADTWRKQTHTNTTVSLHEDQEVYGTYLTEVLLNLITAVGGSSQSEVTLPSQYNAELEGIVRQAIELQKIVSKDVTSTGLVTYTIPCHEEFDPSQMEDVRWDGGEIATASFGRVICTVEMGLRCRKRVNSGSEVRMPVKPKVMLAATPEALCSITLGKLETTMAELCQLLKKTVEQLSSMEVEGIWRNEDRERLEARTAMLDQKNTTDLWGIKGTANERVHVLSAASQAKGVQRKLAATGLRDISMEGKHTHKPPAFVRKPDSISVAEVAELVKILNAQIEQVSVFVSDSLSYTEMPSTGEKARIALNELDVGQWLYSNLRYRSERQMEADPLITQITIQTGLVNVCCGIINGLLNNDYSDAVGARATGTSRALAHSQNERKEIVQKYLMELLFKSITAAGGSLETHHSQYNEKVEDITKKAMELHRIVSQDVTSVELSTYTIPCDTSFDPSQMEDTEGGDDTTVPVVCTLEMGLWCKKKVAHAKQSGFGGDVTMKAKVVLATTLETEIPK